MASLAAQKRTTQAVIDAYNAWNIDDMLAFRAPDCQHQILPSSMGSPAQSNEVYRESFGKWIPMFEKFTLKVRKTVHDPESHTTVLLATSTAETAIGAYANEYALILHFTDDGEKVVKFEEYVDSAYTQKYLGALAAAQQQKAV